MFSVSNPQFNPYNMKKVLVVDDEHDILLMLKSFLSREGYDVKVTVTCEEGLNIFYSFRPDIVLLDVNVGSSDGREMCREIKSKAEHALIPVTDPSAQEQAVRLQLAV